MVRLRTQSDLNLRQGPHNGLILGLFNALEGPEDREHVIALFILLDRLHARIVVLLVAEKDVVEQGALAWKECAGDFEGFGMPIFTLELTLFLYFGFEVLGAGLEQESHLRTHTEVCDNQNGKLSQEGVTTELHLIICLLHEIFHR